MNGVVTHSAGGAVSFFLFNYNHPLCVSCVCSCIRSVVVIQIDSEGKKKTDWSISAEPRMLLYVEVVPELI